jgi:uncharacterized FlgJ-related protein
MKKILLSIVFLLLTLTSSKNVKSQITDEDPKITYQRLYEQIVKHGIKFPDVVFAQAILETGHFTSSLFKNANNLFGMKLPYKRETLAIGKEKRGFAVFDSWTTSVNDYLLWQDYVLRNKNITTKTQYLALLDRIYAENGNYVVYLNRIMKDHKDKFK